MNRVILNNDKSQGIKIHLCSIWDITKPYWYPLFDCNRKDVISFDYNHYIYNNIGKLSTVKAILKAHCVENIYEFREDGRSFEIADIIDYDFWNGDRYFWNNECFWFDDSFNWIIYVCHEGLITFGGQWLIDKLKAEWTDWRENMRYDTKNQ